MLLDVVEKAQHGDSSAILLLLERFTGLLKKYAKRLAYEYEDAFADLRLELIAAIYNIPIQRIKDTCDPKHTDGAVAAYLIKSLYHSYIMLGKKKQQSLEIRWSELSEEQQYCLEAAGNQQSCELAVESVLWGNGLTPQQQNLLYQIYYEQKSIAQIAKENGVSRQSVNQMKNKALKTLRKKIR